MNQFELAKQKAQQRLERAAKYRNLEPLPEVTVTPVVVAPKEKKPSQDAVIDVLVTLPHGEHSFKFIARNVTGNFPQARLNRNEFKKALELGLNSLLGKVIEQ